MEVAKMYLISIFAPLFINGLLQLNSTQAAAALTSVCRCGMLSFGAGGKASRRALQNQAVCYIPLSSGQLPVPGVYPSRYVNNRNFDFKPTADFVALMSGFSIEGRGKTVLPSEKKIKNHIFRGKNVLTLKKIQVLRQKLKLFPFNGFFQLCLNTTFY